MRVRRIVAGVAVLAVALLGNQAVQADPGPAPALDPGAASLEAQRALEGVAGFGLSVVRDARGLAHSVGAPAGRLIALPAGTAADSPEAMARAHLARFASLFGATDPQRELVVVPAAAGLPDDPRDLFVRFQQLRGGIPVLGGELSVVLDRGGALRSITGELLPPGAAPAPAKVDAQYAREAALDVVVRESPGAERETLHVLEPQLTYLDPTLVGLPARLGIRTGPVWHVEVADGAAIRRSVFVDASSGLASFHWNMITTYQKVCDTKSVPNEELSGPDCKPGRYAQEQDNQSPGEADRAWDFTAQSKNFYDDYVGLDLPTLIGSDLGDGKHLRSTVRFCPKNQECTIDPGTGLGLLANAFWNGKGMFYGQGWTAGLDIVAHELAHGVTEKTSRLLYFYQSGAINEAMSDIFGELTDQVNGGAGQSEWLIGEDAPLEHNQLPLRNMLNPTLTLVPPQPDRMTSSFYDPDLAFVDNGGVHVNSGVGNKAGYLLGAGAEFNGRQVTAIGFPKLATILFRVQRMLTSGADYQDLAATLAQSCSDLTGTAGVDAATCTEVADAVAATEMDRQPSVVAAQTPEAPFCPPGLRQDTVLADGFEKLSKKRWTLGKQWIQIGEYASEGNKSLWGIEPSTATTTSLTLNTFVPIPRGASSFLHFDHQYRLDSAPFGPYYDGAKLEYREPGGSWKIPPAKSWVNGPNKRITPEGGKAYTAFGGSSNGYNSSRVDLGFLAGMKAQFRWQVIGDKQIAFDGWTIDDVRFFTCGKDRPSSVGTATVTPRKGALKISWTAPPYVPSGGIGKYRVELVGGPKRNTKPTTLSTTFGKLKKGKTYTLKVTPYSKKGNKAGPSVTRKGKAR